MPAPWITTRDAMCRQYQAFDGAVFLDGLDCVFGAGRCVPTGRRKQGGNKMLIAPDKEDHHFARKTDDGLQHNGATLLINLYRAT